MTDLTVKVLIDDTQFGTLRESAELTASEFAKGFEKVDQTVESTFLRFNRVSEESFKETKSSFDKILGGNDIFSISFRAGLAAAPVDVEGLLDAFDDAIEASAAIREARRNRSIVTDIPIEVNPIVKEPLDVNRIINSQPSEPINLGEIVKEAERKQIQDDIDRLESEGKTILELAQAVRDDLQGDLDEIARLNNVEAPELKINIPDIIAKVETLDRKDLEELLVPSIPDLDPTKFVQGLKNASDDQLRELLALKTILQDLNIQYKDANLLIRENGEATEEVTAKAEQAKVSTAALTNDGIMPLNENLSETNEKVGQAEKTLDNIGGTTKNLTKETRNLDREVKENAESIEVYEENIVKADSAAEQFGENGLPAIAEGAEEVSKALSDIDIQNLINDLSVEDIAELLNISEEDAKRIQEQLSKGFAAGAKDAKVELDALGVFTSDIAANINDTFADLISNGLQGNFDNLGDLWDATLDSMLDSISQLAATILSNPIRVFLEGALRGSSTSTSTPLPGTNSLLGLREGEQPQANNQQNPNLSTQSKVGAGLILGGAAISAIGGAIENNIASSIVGGIGQTVSFAGAGFAAFGAIGAVIGAIIGLVTTLVSVISEAAKKTPRLDLDFDTFRDDVGKSTGEAAKVLDFLDKDLFNNQIFNRSVSRQAGLGLGGGLAEEIRGAIAGQIVEIQDIIFQLPADLASDLNEALLNTTVDIESEVKGDRLLEFDETKDIQQKFQQFIEGDLQARFVQSIRGFFEDAFVALGALPEAAQTFIDQQFETFQGLSREERIEFGENFINEFGAVVDAFNIVNGNSPDSINGTVNSLKNLADTLGFDAVPSIDQLDAELESLISAAEFDPSIIEDMLALRTAILQLQTAILGSIQSIISNISSLNSIIVEGGGSAVDLTGFIDQGASTVQGLLGEEGLTVEDREALLGLGTGFLDQLIAEEQAAFQQQLEAAQQAAEAVAEAQRSAVRAQISGLEDERDLIEENFDARLEALEEELRIAEAFAQLTESIKQTLDSIILGPDSVFTAVERLNIVQGDIASLQSELAATTDPSRQLELAGQLEDSLSTLFDLAGEAFGVNSPEFVAIFDQVTGGLNDLLDLTGNRERSVEEINAEIEALNIERNAQLEAIDLQIESLNEQLSSIQAENVDATFQASDRVQELAEFFRNEYITLLEERFAQLAEVSDTGFATEIDALTNLVGVNEELKELGIIENDLTQEELTVLRDIEQKLQEGVASRGGVVSDGGFIPEFMNGSGGIQNFGSGTLALLHGNEAVLTVEQINDLIQSAGARIGGNVGSPVNLVSAISDSIVEHLGSRIGGNVGSTDNIERLRLRSEISPLANFANLFGSGRFSNFLSDVSSGSGRDSGLVEELAIKLDVNINSNSPGVVDATVNNIEDMLVRSIRQGGKLRSAVQEAGAKRFN